MNDKQKEAFDAVEKINQELVKKYKDKLDFMPQLSITFSNNYIFINISPSSAFDMNLPEILIYNSIHDDRIYYEKTDKYEAFYKFIKRKFKLIQEEIFSIKL